MRGEDNQLSEVVDGRWGLPPRARGRPRGHEREPVLDGTTPACAGKTPRTGRRSGRPWDYPRVRGEDYTRAREDQADYGLPPRARGRQRRVEGYGGGQGTTPACAGKTARPRGGRRRIRDYPRVRGEDPAVKLLAVQPMGLPPRARGRRRGRKFPARANGTTPACAGKTPWGGRLASVTRDYPRVRGEDANSPLSWSLRVGLPPRARGRRR